MASKMPYRIDVHAHMLPPAYRQACLEHGHANPDGMPYLPEWSPEAHLELMEQHNIRKAILSISSPGTNLVHGDSKLAAKVTREANEYAAALKKSLPDRFGYFASLPIPELDICMREVELATQEGCDGFVIETSGHGVYPGDASLAALFDELNRRHATVFFHPTSAHCPCAPGRQQQKLTQATPLKDSYPNPMMEFFFDTARMAVNLFMSGTIARCPDVQFIFPHLGGCFPPLISRFTGFSTLVPGPWTGVSEDEVRAAFQKQIWFDLAGFPFPGQVEALTKAYGVPHTHIMYGSDFPFTQPAGVEHLAGLMDEGVSKMFSEEEVEDLYHRNAERLLGFREPSRL